MSKPEIEVMRNIRLSTELSGGLLLRNNSGAAKELRTGGTLRYVRYGLGNESEALNKKRKSSDLIGITPVLVQPHHVGQTWGIFTGVEVKKEDWTFRGRPEETAQQTFLDLIKKYGGIGMLATCPGDYLTSLYNFIYGKNT